MVCFLLSSDRDWPVCVCVIDKITRALWSRCRESTVAARPWMLTEYLWAPV